jgi:dihydrofolate reductase
MQFDDDTPRAHGMPALGPEVAIIVAIADNGVIGIANRLPWHAPDDLRRFRALTTGHAIIMGRRTWESLPRALPQRQNIVVTRHPDYRPAGAEVASSFDAALQLVRLPPPVFCIGGAEVYAAALPRAAEMYITEIAGSFTGDTRFPDYDRRDWVEISRQPVTPAAGGGPACTFTHYRRVRRCGASAGRGPGAGVPG